MEETNKMAKERVVLAYSGGLDTSIIIPWLKENYDYDVIAVAGDVGQGEELEPLHEKAIKTGASKLYIADLNQEFVEDFIFPTLKAGAVYEKNYLLGTSMARPAIAKALVDIAKKEGAVAICHGATGKGNDQVRFELTIKALAPELKIIAPWRIWDIKSRSQAIDYAKERNIDIPVKKGKSYSMDRNLWHLSHEGEDLEDPWNEPKPDLLDICKTLEYTPNIAEYVEIDFEKGIPVSVDGEKMGGVELIAKLNEIGAKHGVGVDDMVENRLVGIKSRGVYENPAGRILYTAHNSIESITLDRETAHYKEVIALKFADIVYNGQWYSPLREALSDFVDETCKYVTGTVKIKLYKGNCVTVGIKSPCTLYSEEFATFEEDEVYDHKDAGGFINLYGLPQKVNAMREKRMKNK